MEVLDCYFQRYNVYTGFLNLDNYAIWNLLSFLRKWITLVPGFWHESKPEFTLTKRTHGLQFYFVFASFILSKGLPMKPRCLDNLVLIICRCQSWHCHSCIFKSGSIDQGHCWLHLCEVYIVNLTKRCIILTTSPLWKGKKYHTFLLNPICKHRSSLNKSLRIRLIN